MSIYHSTKPVRSSQTAHVPRIQACTSWPEPDVEQPHHDLHGLKTLGTVSTPLALGFTWVSLQLTPTAVVMPVFIGPPSSSPHRGGPRVSLTAAEPMLESTWNFKKMLWCIFVRANNSGMCEIVSSSHWYCKTILSNPNMHTAWIQLCLLRESKICCLHS